MYTLHIKSRGDLVSSWPVSQTVDITSLAGALDKAIGFLRRWGSVTVWVDDGNVSHLIGRWS